MTVLRSGRGQTVLIKSDSPFFVQQCQALVCGTVLAASLNRSRLGPFEGPAIESPRLCRGIVTFDAEFVAALLRRQAHLDKSMRKPILSLWPGSSLRPAHTSESRTLPHMRAISPRSQENSQGDDHGTGYQALKWLQPPRTRGTHRCDAIK